MILLYLSGDMNFANCIERFCEVDSVVIGEFIVILNKKVYGNLSLGNYLFVYIRVVYLRYKKSNDFFIVFV